MTKKWSWVFWGVSGALIITVPATIVSWVSSLDEDWNQLIPELVVAKDIKNSYQRADCLGRYFDDINWSTSPEKKSKKAKFPNFSKDESNSCLTVEYYKRKFNNGLWVGEFKLVWSLADNKHGLITTIKAKADEGKLKLSSVAYLTEHKNNKWKVTLKKENDEGEIKDEIEAFKKIPEVGAIEKHDEFRAFWGFNPKISKICKKGECDKSKGDLTKSSTTWIFSQTPRTTTNVTSWSSALGTWLGKSFKWGNLYKKLEKITGSWSVKKGR